MMKSKPKLLEPEQYSAFHSYAPAVRIVQTSKQSRQWPSSLQYQRSSLVNGLLSLPYNCLLLMPFPWRRLLTRTFRFIFLVILMITVIINILFIIDTRNRLQQQQQQLSFKGNDAGNGRYSVLDNVLSSDVRTIKMEIVSSHLRVMATIDGTIILDDSEEGKNRGIHVLVLNQMTGAIMARRHFDTYSLHEDEAMSLFLSMVSDERIIIFAIKDEGTFQLKKAARDLLTRMGSQHAQHLDWRDMWTCVVQKRLTRPSLAGSSNNGALLGETYSKSGDFNSWASPAILRVEIELLSESNDKCQWNSFTTSSSLFGQLFGGVMSAQDKLTTTTTSILSSSDSESKMSSGSIFLPDDDKTRARRRNFCSRIEGYGSVCSCTDPLPLRFISNYDSFSPISQVPIAIIASNRPHYLYRMLRTLLSTPGCNPAMVTVFIDGYYEEPLEISKLFGLHGIQHTPIGSKSGRISQHYKASLTAIFNLYPDAQYAIVLEEDLDVSPDFFRYFSQTMHLLDEDESLFCISAWNDQAYEHTSSDNSLLYRVETFPGLGWMLRRKLYKEELEARWPTPDKLWDWDMWIRLPEVRQHRECIVPDVSRTFHFGSSGLNMNSYFQDVYFKKHALNMDPSARLANVNSLKRDNYERLLTKLIRLAVLVDHSKSPCDANFLKPTVATKNSSFPLSRSPQSNSENLFLVFIRMFNEHDFDTWLQMARCFHIWDLDARGYHRGLWRLQIHGVHLLVIGAPFSPYSVFKPPHIVPLSLPSKTVTGDGKANLDSH